MRFIPGRRIARATTSAEQKAFHKSVDDLRSKSTVATYMKVRGERL